MTCAMVILYNIYVYICVSTAYVNVGRVSVLTEMEGLHGISRLSGKAYFGQEKVSEFYA